MKRFLLGGLLALGLAAPVKADFCLQWNCCHNLSIVRTCRNRCWNFSSYVNPLPCMGYAGHGYSGPAPWNALAAYGYKPAPVAAVPAAAAPAAAPTFRAPPPAPAPKNSTGVQQAGYFYYGQPTNAGYGYGYGYYGYGANYSYAQVPNYWY